MIQIFDHRPFDTDSNWTNRNIKLRIEEVGSCSTLIADEILRIDENFLIKNLAYSVYGNLLFLNFEIELNTLNFILETIIYDTVALLPENGRTKELDLVIAKKLEDKFCFNEGRNIVYNKLWTAHNDVLHLSPKQILVKDLKIIENIPVPGLPMLVENFLKLKDAYNAVENMAAEYGVSLLVLVGLEATNEVKRDVGIFWKGDGVVLKNTLLANFNNSDDLKGYNFCFKEVCSGYTNVICLQQNNIKLSRKQIIPLIKDALLGK